MSKRHGKISLILIGFLLTLSTILSFAEPPEAPNQLITENPYKEVKTVEANKNREHAEMNISVDKLNLKNLEGYKISDTEYYIELPSEENLKENETYYVSKSIEDLPDIYSVNGEKTITNLNRFKDYSIETADFSYEFTDNFILIDRAPIDTQSFIVSKLNKSSGEIKKVYEVNKFKAANISELQGETVNGNSQIAFKLTDEMMDIFSENQREIKIVKTLKGILNKGNRVKRSLDRDILNYELDRENRRLVVDNSNSVEELKIVVLNSGRIEKIYRGEKAEKASTKIVLPTENFNIPEDSYGTRRMYINEEFNQFGSGARVKAVTFDGEKHIKKLFPREHYAKGNIVFLTNEDPADYDKGKPYIKVIRIGGYVPKITKYQVTVELQKNGNTIEKSFIITEYPQKNILEKSLEDYTIGQNLITKRNTFYANTLNLEEFIENKKASWRTYLGLQTELPIGDLYNKLNLFKRENKNIKESNLYGELKTTGFKGVGIGGYARSTKVIGEMTGTYKIFFSRKSIGKIKVELDSRIVNIAKKNPNLSNLVGGTHLTNNLSNWLNDGINYSEMTRVTNNLNPPVGISSYITYVGRSILSQENRKQIFSNRNDNNKGLALPVGSVSENNMLEGFSVNLTDFNNGEQENAIFTYKRNDNKNYSGEVEISIGNQRELLGSGSVDLTNISKNQVHIFPKTGSGSIVSDNGLTLENITGDLPNTTSLNSKSILNNISFKVQSSTVNFEKIEGNPKGTYPQEVILDDSRLPFKIGLTSDGALKIEKLKDENYSYTIEMNYRYNKATLGVFKINIINQAPPEGKVSISFDSNNFAMIREYGKGYYGWSIVHPTSSSNHDAKITYLEAYEKEMTDKNGQSKQAKITGKTHPLTAGDLGKQIKFTVGGETRVLTLMASSTNALDSIHFYNLTGITIGLDYDGLASYNGGMYLGFSNWDLEAKDFNIKVEASTFANEYSVKIPEFNGEVYYDKNISQTLPTEVDYNTKTLKGNITREETGEMQIKFNIGTKNYDLAALGKDGSYVNLNLKVPKQINLNVQDEYGIKKIIPFSITVTADSSKGYIIEKNDNYYIYAPNDGVQTSNSEIRATVVLKAMFKREIKKLKFKRSTNSSVSTNHMTGASLNLVSIGAKSKNGIEKYSTIVDSMNLKMELANFSETIDVSNTPISQKVYSTNGYYGLIQNENKLVLKDGNKTLFETTFEELTKTKKEISEAGVSIKYNSAQDANKNQFEFEKVKGVNYNKTLRLEIYTSGGQLLYYIDFNIINKVVFEILPGKGVLDFGDFFPGDIKKSESLIEFKNPNGAKIDVSLNPTNTEKMFKVGAKITPNTTIPLSNIQIKDLKTESNNINSFRISGEAKTTPKTEIGQYKGELDVIVTVIP